MCRDPPTQMQTRTSPANAVNAVNVTAENQLGRVLRGLRKERGMTLLEASERIGLPVSTLSKIENNKMSISYDKLVAICKGLKIDMAQLFGAQAPLDDAPVVAPASLPAAAPAPVPAAAAAMAPPAVFTARRSITRAGAGYTIATPNYTHLYPAADLLHKQIVPIVGEIHARSIEEFGDMLRHAGEEYAFVLEGAVELHTDLYAPTRLETGDSIYFDSGMAHAYIAAAPGPCRILTICPAHPQQPGLQVDAHASPPSEPAPPARKR